MGMTILEDTKAKFKLDMTVATLIELTQRPLLSASV